VICCEEARGQHSIVVVNDTLRRAQGRLQVRRAGDAANLLQASFDVDSNGKATLGVLPHPVQTEMWLLTWTTGAADSCASHYLAVSGKVNLAEYKAWMKWMGLPSV